MHIIKMQASDVKDVLDEAAEMNGEKRKEKSKEGKVDPTKTHLNRNLCPNERVNKSEVIKEIIKHLGVKRKIREDAVLSCSCIINIPQDYTGDPERFMKVAYKVLIEVLCEGNENRVLQSIWHRDEGSEHMHFSWIPIVQGKDGKNKLSAKEQLTKNFLLNFHPMVSEKMSEYLEEPILLWNEEKCKDRQERRAKGDRSSDYVSLSQYKAGQERKTRLANMEEDIDMAKMQLSDYQKGLEYIQGLISKGQEELDDIEYRKQKALAELGDIEIRKKEATDLTNTIKTLDRKIQSMSISLCHVKDETINDLLSTKLDRYAVAFVGVMSEIKKSYESEKPVNKKDKALLQALNITLDELKQEIESEEADGYDRD